MKCLIKYTVNLRCRASSKREAEKYLKPDINKLKAFCTAFGISTRTICNTYEPDTGDKFDVGYLFCYEIFWIGEFRFVLNVSSAINSFANVNAIEVTDEEINPFNDEE